MTAPASSPPRQPRARPDEGATMAFGFIKKVFSFGKKDEAPAPDLPVETVAEAPVLPDFLRREPDQQDAVSDAAALTESPPDAVEPAGPETASIEFDAAPAPEIIATPAGEETAPSTVEEAAPAAEVAEAAPSAEFLPPLRQPPPVETSPIEAESAPEPQIIAPPVVEEIAPSSVEEEAPAAAPAEAVPTAEFLPPLRQPPPVETAPVEAESAPEPDLIAAPHPVEEIASVADEEPEATPVQAAPTAEFLPPLRQAPPVETAPVEAEAAPEPDIFAPPGPEPRPAAGKVTVARSVAPKAELVAEPAAAPRTTWFQRLRQGLSRSSRELTGSIAGIFTKRKLDAETLEELEEVLIRADLGMEIAVRVTDALSASRYGKDVSDADVRSIMAQEIEKVLTPVALPLELDLSHKPHVILVVGVNGTGKTTTIGKLAAKLTAGGLSVMLAAGDTFRAAAIEQLKIWGERTGSPVVSSKIGADASGLAWDAFEKAKAAGADVLIIDTAGRLQNRAELMAELEKIVRVLGKHDPEAPHTVLQTVDATTGQNALNQVEIFRNVAGVNGLVMTKLDGTARGGILAAIAAKHRLPVYFIGVGEQVDDLEPFSASDFAKAIAGVG